MRIVFFVQGEGRGHLTQALALSQLLEYTGHELAAVLVGQSNGREVPDFFTKNIAAPVHTFASPNLIFDKERGCIDIPKTIRVHLGQLPAYLKSLKSIRRIIDEVRPDVIVNFYELVGGAFNFLYRPGIPMVCIAHQYLLLSPTFPFPKNSWWDRQLVNLNTRITALGATKKLALSFRPIPDETPNTRIVPPLLRQELQKLRPSTADYILVYMTQHGLGDQIIDWHKKHPDVTLHCFWDNPNAEQEVKISEKLCFHQINAARYLKLMEGCKGLVTTAGFESVCEAMYLGKPVLMVPVPGHFEQACNAIDGVISGAGINSPTFDLSLLTEFIEHYDSPQRDFQKWYFKGNTLFIRELENVVKHRRTSTVFNRPAWS